jgi:hypothetical protein
LFPLMLYTLSLANGGSNISQELIYSVGSTFLFAKLLAASPLVRGTELVLSAKVFRIESQIDFQVGWDPSRSSEEPDDANNKQGTHRGDWSALRCVELGSPPPHPRDRRTPIRHHQKKKKKKGREKGRNLTTSGGRIGDVVMVEPMEPTHPTNPAPA